MPSVSRSQENTHVISLCWGCANGIPPVMPVDMRTPLPIHRPWARAHILMIAPAHRQTARSTRSSISFSSTLLARQFRFYSLPLGSSYGSSRKPRLFTFFTFDDLQTSVLHDSIIQEGGGAACFPRLDGAHPQLAQPTFLLSFLRARLCWSRRSEADGIILYFSPT